MFDIAEFEMFDICLFLTGSLIFVFLLFARYIKSTLDPLLIKCVWLASHLALLLLLMSTGYINLISLMFLFFIITYMIVLRTTFSVFGNKKGYMFATGIKELDSTDARLFYLALIVSLMLFIISKIEFIQFMLDNSWQRWFSYRYAVEFKGRNPVLRILELGSIPFMLFYCFYFIFIAKKHLYSAVSIILFYFLINLLSGSKGALVSVLISAGYFSIRFESFIARDTRKRLNYTGFILIVLALCSMALVLSFIERAALGSASMGVLNRILANGDGMSYAVKYDILSNLESGVVEYFQSLFGIYTSGIFGIKTKSIGWQLTELAAGTKLSFAQGSNYTLFIQCFIIGLIPALFVLLPLYSWVYVQLRSKIAKVQFFWSPLAYSIGLSLLTFYTDGEFSVLKLIGVLVFYLLLLAIVISVMTLWKMLVISSSNITRTRSC